MKRQVEKYYSPSYYIYIYIIFGDVLVEWIKYCDMLINC